MFKKIVSFIVMTSFVITMTGALAPFTAMAASISSAKATFGRLKASTASESVIVQFVSPTGIQNSSDTISLTFSADFTLAAETAVNFDIGMGNSGTCSTASYTDETVSLTPNTTDWGVDVTSNVVTFTPKSTGGTLTAGYCIRIEMGTAATTGGTGSASTVTNGAVDDDDTITIAGGFGDTGTITVDIVDDDQVTVTATVNQTMTFDLDTATTGTTETNTPYTVPLGTLSSSTVAVSGGSINMIIAEGDTNASGGMNVTVRNNNGANGLTSTSAPIDRIESTTATMVAGTENYGLCVASAALSGFGRATAYNTTCALSSSSNSVIGLTSTASDILTSATPVSGAHAEIVVNAAIAGATPAHDDYTDTLTFIATSSY
jgi:hypothetical protein